MTDRPWWMTAVAYQVYPRSFADGNGDGIGDLPGLIDRLDHLSWLGVDALWLSPVYPSPMADFGYDVSDYCDVDPTFGTLDDLDHLVAEAHRRDVRVVLDWVPNHTSDQHPWFLASRSSRDDPQRSWYWWRDPAPGGGPPNNWVGSFLNGPAWTLDEGTGQYYLHLFLPEQPDLNWGEPAVVEAMHDTLRFWLDRGVDGFRMDVVHLIGKDPDLADDPDELAGLTHVPLNDRAETHELLRGIREVMDGYPGDRMAIGEVYLLDPARVATYHGAGDELHLAFNFSPLYAPWLASAWRRQVATAEAEMGAVGAWPTWVLSNHDNVRHRTRFGGGEARARAAAVLLLSMRGTPWLYAGEELGLEDAEVPPDRVVDPGGRDGCRAPIAWDGSPGHGWDVEPWLPWAPRPEATNVEAQRADAGSVLHLYRRLIAARKASPALTGGDIHLLDVGHPDVLAFRRTDPTGGGDDRVVLVNFTDVPVAIDHLGEPPGPAEPIGAWEVETTSVGAGDRAGDRFDGALAADEAVVLRPAGGPVEERR